MRRTKIQVLMSEEETTILDKMAQKRGLSRSAYLRALLLAAAQKEKANEKGVIPMGGDYDPPMGDHCSLFTE